jgi:hypothetical protein
MKTKIEFTSNYGFDHNWILVCETPKQKRAFYLGQDVKFCNRVLGMSPSYVVNQIGTNRLDTIQGNIKLAKFICKQLGINGKNMHKLQDWSICAE